MVAPRKDMLKKLAMPKKPMAEEEANQDLALEDMGMAEEDMGMAMEDMSGEEMPEEGNPLEDFSDEDLIKEFKNRGLSLNKEEEMEGEEMPEEEEMV